jgi:DNA-binding winged helix-turn-helix (wHTH) protein
MNRFKERNLRKDFCKKQISEVKKLIESSISFSVVGIPAMGISIFLRYLATRNFYHFIHIDIYDLSAYSKKELFKLLLRELEGNNPSATSYQLLNLCKQRLENLTTKHHRVVIVFNRFDQLKNEFKEEFFNNLRALRDVDKEKIVMIFSANKPLIEQAKETISLGNLNMFSKTYFLNPYTENELKQLLKLNAPNLKLNQEDFNKAISLTGGHYQLLQLILKSESPPNNLLADPIINLQLKQLYEYLDYSKKKLLQKLILGKKINLARDQYLFKIGYLKKIRGKYQIFTPLLADYIKAHLRLRLPVKEAILFQFLKNNEGKIITKDEIFTQLWPDHEGETSDWALNALIYRLRKNPTFVASGYLIENQKKAGYLLTVSYLHCQIHTRKHWV